MFTIGTIDFENQLAFQVGMKQRRGLAPLALLGENGAGIGMVHQHFTLAENLTALENILLGSESLLSWRSNRAAAREKISKIMARTGLSAPLDEAISTLSVGARQRVEILKALYHDARILVLDEPTAVLTPHGANLTIHAYEVVGVAGVSAPSRHS